MVKLKADGIGTLTGRLLVGTAEKIPSQEIVDTTGAGDAFIGAVLYGMLKTLKSCVTSKQCSLRALHVSCFHLLSNNPPDNYQIRGSLQILCCMYQSYSLQAYISLATFLQLYIVF